MITDFRAYVKSILIEMEGSHINGSSPHKAAFGTFGKSGLTYGELQNDVGQGDADVVGTFEDIINHHPEFTPEERTDVIAKAKTPGARRYQSPRIF